MKYFSILLVLLIATSCAPVRVNYDYEKTTDFKAYKTYNYYANLDTGLSELDTKRLLDALDNALQTNGYTLSETPDFFIDIKSNEYQEAARNNVGVGLGGTGGRVGGGVSIGIPVGQNKLNRQIIFEFVDENKNGLFWQAVSESSYSPKASPEKREAIFKSIVAKVLEGFPPKVK
ncbi:DUF4136 domain-containing protein [Psychroserpens ponticola]|uniref:DUF4136 domain-containing protein n=1 Tax=Psychroserpens ponticola TaxID=2932268 RepID=A0ABY7RVI1_9FLAO|nr:DUF4136 domain-containing protein [Psychroserpens ponticola]WCO00978.1 DUF4136 domain-containing protein [Psychroserpens ponticola]